MLTATEVWRTRLETSLTNWRTRSQLEELKLGRGPMLQALGAAVRSGDRRAANEASKRLDELDEQEQSLQADLARQVAQAKERIRLARLPVQETVMVAPNEPFPPASVLPKLKMFCQSGPPVHVTHASTVRLLRLETNPEGRET